MVVLNIQSYNILPTNSPHRAKKSQKPMIWLGFSGKYITVDTRRRWAAFREPPVLSLQLGILIGLTAEKLNKILNRN